MGKKRGKGEQGVIDKENIEVGTFTTNDGLPSMGLKIHTPYPVDTKQEILDNQTKAQESDKLRQEIWDRLAEISLLKDELQKLQILYDQEHAIVERLRKTLEGLPIYCRVCGEKLTMSATYPNSVTFGCSGNGKAGRGIADKHYSDSVREFTYGQFDAYEMLELYLNSILEGKKE